MKKNKCAKCGKVWYCKLGDCTYPKDDCACSICLPVPEGVSSSYQCREHKIVWRIA